MKNFVLMHAMNGFKKVFGDERGCFFCQVFVLRNKTVELTIAAQFHQGIEVNFIIEKTVKINNVWMVQKGLNFEFAGELLQNIVLGDFFLFDNLHGHNKTRCDLPYHVNFAELALS